MLLEGEEVNTEKVLSISEDAVMKKEGNMRKIKDS